MSRPVVTPARRAAIAGAVRAVVGPAAPADPERRAWATAAVGGLVIGHLTYGPAEVEPAFEFVLTGGRLVFAPEADGAAPAATPHLWVRRLHANGLYEVVNLCAADYPALAAAAGPRWEGPVPAVIWEWEDRWPDHAWVVAEPGRSAGALARLEDGPMATRTEGRLALARAALALLHDEGGWA